MRPFFQRIYIFYKYYHPLRNGASKTPSHPPSYVVIVSPKPSLECNVQVFLSIKIDCFLFELLMLEILKQNLKGTSPGHSCDRLAIYGHEMHTLQATSVSDIKKPSLPGKLKGLLKMSLPSFMWRVITLTGVWWLVGEDHLSERLWEGFQGCWIKSKNMIKVL